MKQLMFILMCLALASPLKAEEGLTGTMLYNCCTRNDRSGQALCLMWMDGFFQGMASAQTLANYIHLTPVTCFPDDLTGEQARLTIEKHMRDHPEELHNQAGVIAAFALALAFPCKK